MEITSPQMANEIGGQYAFNSVKIEDFNKHVSVEAIRHSYQSHHFEFNKIDSSAVENELKKLNTHKTTGREAISNIILKQVAVSLAPSVTNLFNTSIESGWSPSNWRRESGPQFSKRRTGKLDRADYANYRPVTVLNAVAKVFNHCSQTNHRENRYPFI